MSDENQDNIYEPPNNNRQPELRVTNPIQAASEIFYKPKDVFDALADTIYSTHGYFVYTTLFVFWRGRF
jgi:hypothetical protein